MTGITFELSEVGGEGFDQFPAPPFTEGQQAARDGVVVDGLAQIIARGGEGEVALHHDRELEPLGLGALGIRPTLVGAPVGHAIGMQGGLLAPVLRGQPVFLIDQWDPGMVLDVIEEFHCTSGSGSTR